MIETSYLDTDLYKLTMQACILKHFKDANVEYLLHNRNNSILNEQAVQWVKDRVAQWDQLTVTKDELEYLRQVLPFLSDDYFDYLSKMHLNPKEEVEIRHFKKPGSDEYTLEIAVRGAWPKVMWYEVPILAAISEAFFKFVDTDWNMDGQFDKAKNKAERLVAGECPFSEFGSRRRRSQEIQMLAIEGLLEGAKGSPLFTGTSNVLMAKKYGLKPIGTVAHELVMGIAAYTRDYLQANKVSMEVWVDTVGPDHAGVVLTDTFGTPLFLSTFKPPYSDIYGGVRHDSGDPEEFTQVIADYYKSIGISPNTKRIVYSDSLTVEKCLEFKQYAIKYGLIPAFGIGTYFTNDFMKASAPEKKSPPLNIVMKLSKVNDYPVVKLSDNKGKHTGDAEEIKRCKAIVNYVYSSEPIDEAHRWG